MHPLTLGLGVFVFLLGIFLVFIGGIAVIFTFGGFFAISVGVFLALVGAVAALVGWFI